MNNNKRKMATFVETSRMANSDDKLPITSNRTEQDDFQAEFLTCSLCGKPYDNDTHRAKCLSCLHSFGSSCLISLIKQTRICFAIIPCPTCHTIVVLNEEIVDDLPNNFIAETMVDIYNSALACHSCDDGSLAVSFCHTCDCFPCQRCVDEHKRMRPLRNHKLSSLTELRAQKYNPIMGQLQRCKKHPEQDLSLYCKETGCNVLVCATCGPIDHQSHDVVDIKTVIDEVVADVRQSTARINHRIHEVDLKQKAIETKEKELTDSYIKAEKDIKESVEKLRILLNSRYNKACFYFKHLYHTEKDRLTRNNEAMTRLTGQMKNAFRFAHKACEIQHPARLLASRNQIMLWLTKLENAKLPDTLPDQIKFDFTGKHYSGIDRLHDSLEHLWDVDSINHLHRNEGASSAASQEVSSQGPSGGMFGSGSKGMSFEALATDTGNGFANKDASGQFAFANAGAQLFTQGGGDGPDADGHDGQNQEYDPQYEAIVTLPDAVDLKTGHEEEECLYKQRCRLYRFDAEKNQWKERGVGDVKLMKHKDTGRVRVVMRREQVHKVCANHTITTAMQLKVMEMSDRAWVYNAIDFSEGEASPELLAIKFKTPDIAHGYKTKFEECQTEMAQLPVLPQQQEETVSKEKPKDTSSEDLKAKFAMKTGEWECDACYTRNPADKTACLACQTPKPGAAAPSAAPAMTGGFKFGAPQTGPSESKASVNLMAKFAPQPGQWECDICCVRNLAEKTACVSCSTPKPGATQPSTAPSTTSGGFKFGNTQQSSSAPAAQSTGGFNPGPGGFPSFTFGTQSTSNPSTGQVGIKIAGTQNLGFTFGTSHTSSATTPVKQQQAAPNAERVELNTTPGGTPTTRFSFDAGDSRNTGLPQFSFGNADKDPQSTNTGFMFGGVSSVPSTPERVGSVQDLTQASPPQYPFTKALQSFGAAASTPDGASTSFSDMAKSTGTAFSFRMDIGSDFSPKPSPPKPKKSPGFTTPAKSPGGKDGEYYQSEEGDDIHFEPIVQLPDQVELKTGEEGEDVVFSHRSKLYRFDTETNQWKERGIGDIKLLHNPTSNRYRIVMRRDQVFRVCANHYLNENMKLTPNAGSDRSWVWQAMDASDGDPLPEQLAVKFKSPDTAAKFKDIFEAAVEDLKINRTTVVVTTDSSKSDVTTTPEICDAQSSKPSEDFMAKFAIKPGQWECDACYTRNPPDCAACLACQTPKPVDVQLSEISSSSSEPEEADKPAKNDDLMIVSVKMPSAALQEKAKSLQLPLTFYNYEDAPPCPGCIGCDPDNPDMNRQTREQHQAEADSANKLASNQFGTSFAASHEVSSQAPSSGMFGSGSKGMSFKALVPDAGSGFNKKDTVHLKTGHEEKKCLYKQKCHLYQFDAEKNQWKERGVGDVKLMKHSGTGRVRVVMRRDQVHKVCVNEIISTVMHLTDIETSDHAWVYSAIDLLEGQTSLELVAVMFETQEIAHEFKVKFAEWHREICQLPVIQQESSENHAAKFTPKSAEWECSACYTWNPVDKTSCLACQTPKPGAAAPSAASAMTETFEPLQSGPQEWECDACNTCNPTDAITCEGCWTPKPGAAPSDASSITGGFKFGTPLTRLAELKLTEDQKLTKTAKLVGKWECDACYTRNPVKKMSCLSCHTPKPGTAPAPVAFAGIDGLDLGTPQASVNLKECAPEPVKWRCNVCGKCNPSDKTACSSCLTSKPNASAVAEFFKTLLKTKDSKLQEKIDETSSSSTTSDILGSTASHNVSETGIMKLTMSPTSSIAPKEPKPLKTDTDKSSSSCGRQSNDGVLADFFNSLLRKKEDTNLLPPNTSLKSLMII